MSRPADVRLFSESSMPVVWTHRWLLIDLTIRELRTRYLSGLSGAFWVLVHPLALLAVYGYVFTVIFQARFPESSQAGFVPYLAVGLWPWLAFSESLQRAASAIRDNADLVGRVPFPQELLVYARVAAIFLTHTIGFFAVLVVLKFMGAPIHLVMLPMALLLLVVLAVFAAGLGLILATLQVFFRDVQQVLPPLLMIWFFATPILYPPSLVPARMSVLLVANPLSWYVGKMRDLLLGGEISYQPLDLLWVLVTLLALAGGVALFRRCSGRFQDFL
jgi:ABC-type polysaccharide/polyol phosphate export permease